MRTDLARTTAARVRAGTYVSASREAEAYADAVDDEIERRAAVRRLIRGGRP